MLCKLILGLLLVLNIADASAQKFIFRNYTVEDGIPQSNANDIFQDKEGYLWFATQKGAGRFDGKEFTSITENDGLISNLVLSLYQDHEEAIWFGTRFGISRYKDKRFYNFSEYEGLPSNLIRQIIEDDDHIIWVATHGGLCKFSDSLFHVVPDFKKDVKRLFADKQGLWIGVTDGLYLLKDGKVIKIAEFPSVSITDIVKDSHGHMWISSLTGLYKFNPNERTFSRLKIRSDFLPIIDLLVDSDDNLWMASEGKGICKFDGSVFQYFDHYNGFTNLSVFAMYEDHEQNIWIGGRNGLTMFNPRIPFVHYEFDGSFQNNDFFGMIQDSKGNYWFTTYGAGIVKFDGKSHVRYNEDHGLQDLRFISVVEDRKQNLWFGSASMGIVQYDGKKFKGFRNEGLPPCRVFNLIVDREDHLWIATQELGLIKYDGRTFERMNEKWGIPTDITITVFEDSKGNIWFSSIGRGLYKYTPGVDDEYKVVFYNEKHNLVPNYIRCITEDAKGNIWLGTASQGVVRISEKDTISYKELQESDGLKSNNIYILKFDKKGHLWVGTEKGIERIILDEDDNLVSIKNYHKAQGFTGVETSLNGVLEDNEGALWFGTISGVSKYTVKYDRLNLVTPQTHIKEIKLFYQDTDWTTLSDSIENNLPVNLVLPYDRNHLTFHFIGICLSNPQEVRYQFMLEGFDKTWSPKLTKNEAVYTSLQPGHYTFKVKSSNDDMLWNDVPTEFSFVIKPPLWQELWFILLILSLIVFGIIIIVRWRLYELKKAKKILERKVEERTMEIIEQNEKISRQKEEIEKKNQVLEIQNLKIANQRDILSHQKSQIEIKNKDITDSIGYAQRIQNALLPSTGKIKQHFNDSFILYKPKDIVSGDFFWFSERRNKLIIATVDCTGHGIPGAFMAMIGDSLLNQIINQTEILEPDRILNKLHEGVRNALNQENNENTDGMDIALCVIDKGKQKLSFAGAKSSLIYFENGCQHIIKGNRNPIGSGLFTSPAPYRTQVVNIEDDSRFYIFTDGYQDQFGGEKNKKYMIKRFKQLLEDVHHHPFEKQKLILDEEIENWKSGQEQIDDILVIGFQVL